MRLLRLTIKLRMIICVVLITGLSLLAVAYYITHKNMSEARETGLDYAEQTAETSAAEVQSQLLSALRSSRDLASEFNVLVAAGGDRKIANAELKAVLTNNSDYLGAWTLWEPNAFDGMDRKYRNAGVQNDATGRFIPWWFRNGDAIETKACSSYTVAGDGDYYISVVESGEEKLEEPYGYDIGGESVLMSSMVVPIVRSGKVAGVTGIDMSLDSFSSLVSGIKPFGTGSAVLLSAGGLLVAGGDSSQAGQAADSAVVTLAGTAATSGSPERRVIGSGDDEQVQIAAPIVVGNDTWSLVVTVPTATILASAISAQHTSMWITLGAVVLAALIALAVARSMVKPIESLSGRMAEIADGDGDLTQRAEVVRDDEAGQLAGAFNRFVEKVAGTVRGIAGSATEVQAAADRLAESTDRLNGDAAQVSDKSGTAAEATQTVNYSVQSVAAGAEEMNAAIGEIASSAAQAAQVA
ncbi:methyl-accepting chemotaxis protein, partial [Actinoplanes sp. NPDC051851]|uniref:methyl-accepting chemotaxis protein n=1 Tax=Actinoplanes sp. NPDC051851 TaxID=3154753 RepID=UPI0034197432